MKNGLSVGIKKLLSSCSVLKINNRSEPSTTEVLPEGFGFTVPSVCFCFGQPSVERKLGTIRKQTPAVKNSHSMKKPLLNTPNRP